MNDGFLYLNASITKGVVGMFFPGGRSVRDGGCEGIHFCSEF